MHITNICKTNVTFRQVHYILNNHMYKIYASPIERNKAATWALASQGPKRKLQLSIVVYIISVS